MTDLIQHGLNRLQQPAQRKGSQDGRKKEQEYQPVGCLTNSAGKRDCLGLYTLPAPTRYSFIKPRGFQALGHHHPYQTSHRPASNTERAGAHGLRGEGKETMEKLVEKLGDERYTQVLKHTHKHKQHYQLKSDLTAGFLHVRFSRLLLTQRPSSQTIIQRRSVENPAYHSSHNSSKYPTYYQDCSFSQTQKLSYYDSLRVNILTSCQQQTFFRDWPCKNIQPHFIMHHSPSFLNTTQANMISIERRSHIKAGTRTDHVRAGTRTEVLTEVYLQDVSKTYGEGRTSVTAC